MQEILAILELITTRLPEVKRTLGQARWPAFADRLRAHAASFQNLTDKADLTHAVNELAGLFVAEPALFEIITRPNPKDGTTTSLPSDERQHPSNSEAPPEIVKLGTIPNRFFLLCEHADLIAAGDTLAEIAARSGAQRAAEPVHSNATTGFSADRTDRGQV